MNTSATPDFGTVSAIIELLRDLPKDQQAHVLRTVQTWLDIGRIESHSSTPYLSVTESKPSSGRFTDREYPSAKQFLFEKDPHTDVERLACLAYYLTHYRATPDFKTADLSKLNTEAAQRKFANAAYTTANAIRDGLLAPSSKQGFKQLSAYGEQYVNALPDHEQARSLRRRMKPSRSRRTSRKRSNRVG